MNFERLRGMFSRETSNNRAEVQKSVLEKLQSLQPDESTGKYNRAEVMDAIGPLKQLYVDGRGGVSPSTVEEFDQQYSNPNSVLGLFFESHRDNDALASQLAMLAEKI